MPPPRPRSPLVIGFALAALLLVALIRNGIFVTGILAVLLA